MFLDLQNNLTIRGRGGSINSVVDDNDDSNDDNCYSAR